MSYIETVTADQLKVGDSYQRNGHTWTARLIVPQDGRLDVHVDSTSGHLLHPRELVDRVIEL